MYIKQKKKQTNKKKMLEINHTDETDVSSISPWL